MKSDIQIAREASMLPIKEVANGLGITEDDIELYSTLETRSEIIIDTHIQDVINNYSNLFV